VVIVWYTPKPTCHADPRRTPQRRRQFQHMSYDTGYSRCLGLTDLTAPFNGTTAPTTPYVCVCVYVWAHWPLWAG
jgi:hypothetical protein